MRNAKNAISLVSVTLGIMIVMALVVSNANAKNPYVTPDQSWITLDGTVVSANSDAFLLDYGEGLITVEMDDWDWYHEGNNILDGDRVTVYGKIDNDLYEARTIEASSVFVKGLNTFFFANPDDEEVDPSIGAFNMTLPAEDGSRVNLSGNVDKINGRVFMLDTGPSKIKVDTKGMLYNPLDDKGYQKLRKGDYVTVGGYLDLNFFEKREIQATSVVTLSQNKSG